MADKRLERWYLEQLRHAVPEFPSGAIESDESPDFVVHSARGRVGIEITVFHWPPENGERPYQEEQALKDRAVSTALRIHTEAGGPGLHVTVFFTRSITFGKRDVGRQADLIAQAVLDTDLPQSIDEPAVEVSWDRLPPCVAAISIRASIDGRDRLWSADAGGWVAPVSPGHIQAVLSRKTAMASRAVSKCRELWLVVVNDEFNRSAPVELAEESAQAAYDHPFDRVFWLEPHTKRAWELQPANKPLQPTSGGRARDEVKQL